MNLHRTACPAEDALPERQSECLTCPPWVIRCAHFDDDAIWFTHGGQFFPICPHQRMKRELYAVLRRSQMRACSHNGELCHIGAWDNPLCMDADEALVLAAFHAEEARLLGREASS